MPQGERAAKVAASPCQSLSLLLGGDRCAPSASGAVFVLYSAAQCGRPWVSTARGVTAVL